MKATGTTTYGFAAHGLTYSDVGAAASSHTHSGADINSGTVGLSYLPTGVKTSGIAFCLLNPATDAESARYILRSDKTGTYVNIVSTSTPTSAITCKIYQGATEIASVSHSTTSSTSDITDVSLSSGDVLYAKISGAVNGVTNITIELTVVDR
jgi:hypothetical protein